MGNQAHCVRAAALCMLSAGALTQVHAQGTVTIFGVLDAGIGYVSNIGGDSIYRANPGVFRPDAMGFSGAEDLGGGSKAIFYLGTDFSLQNGAVYGAPGTLFSRESYVGLQNQYGRVTFGDQRDFMFDTLTMNGYPGSFFGGAIAAHQGPFSSFVVPYSSQGAFDFDRVNGEAIANSVKFKSANFSGLTFGAMYSFGGVAGAFGNSSANSFGINYEFGPASLGAAYTMTKAPNINYGNDGIRNAGVGFSYRVKDVLLAGLVTLTRNTATGALINAYDASIRDTFTPDWDVSLTYSYMLGNEKLGKEHANQLTSMLAYHFSKRTMVYADVAWQVASGRNALAEINAAGGQSSSSRQVLTTLSILHGF